MSERNDFKRDIIECIICGWNQDFGLKLGSLPCRYIANFIVDYSDTLSVEKITEIYHEIINEIEDEKGIGNVSGYFDDDKNVEKFKNDFLAVIERRQS